MQQPQVPSKPLTLDKHDWKVIAFQIIIAMIQVGLIKLGTYDFGIYTPYVVMGIQVASEALRRYIAG